LFQADVDIFVTWRSEVSVCILSFHRSWLAESI
jgi:hypothetical protein